MNYRYPGEKKFTLVPAFKIVLYALTTFELNFFFFVYANKVRSFYMFQNAKKKV